MCSSLKLSVLVLLGLCCTLVSSRPSPQDPDSEPIVRVPPPQLAFVPFFLASPGEGSVVGEVVVKSANVAVKRSKKKNSKTRDEGPTFAARVDPQASPSTDLDDTNSVGDTIFFNQPSAVIQLS